MQLTYPPLQLSPDDGDEVFGISPDLEKCLPEEPRIDDEDQSAATEASLLFFEFGALDAAADSVINSILTERVGVDNDASPDAMEQPVEGSSCAIRSENSDSEYEDEGEVPSLPSKRKRKHKNRGTHSTALDTYHRRKVPSRKRRYGPQSMFRLWGPTLDKLSPVFNVFEKGLLKYLALHVIQTEDRTELQSLAAIDVSSYPYTALARLWSVLLSALKEEEVGTFIRAKTETELKDELKRQVAFKKHSWNVQPRNRIKQIIQRLLEGGQQLRGVLDDAADTRVVAQEADDVLDQSIHQTEADQVVLSEEHTAVADLPECPVDNSLLAEEQTQMGSQVLTEEVIEECLEVIEEFSNQGRNIRWKGVIFCKWRERFKWLKDSQCSTIQNRYKNMKAASNRALREQEESVFQGTQFCTSTLDLFRNTVGVQARQTIDQSMPPIEAAMAPQPPRHIPELESEGITLPDVENA